MRKLNTILCRLIFVTLIFSCSAAFAQTVSQGEALNGMTPFDEAMEGLMKGFGFPGGSLAVSFQGRLQLAKGYGYASKSFFGTDHPATPQHRWRVASISKPITAVTILHLAETARLQLDDPLVKHLGSQRPEKLQDARVAQITLRNLLQHRSGLPGIEAGKDPMFRRSPPCPYAAGHWLEQIKLPRGPGKGFAYSNLGYCLLGLVIENCTGVSYEQAVQKLVAPLGITSFRIGNAQESEEGEVTYEPSAEESNRQPYGYYDMRALGPAGGWTAMPVDIVRFLNSIDQGPNPLLKRPESFAEILKQPTDWSGSEVFYGLGFLVRPVNHPGTLIPANIWHYGNLVGTSAFAAKMANGWTVAAVFNRCNIHERKHISRTIDRSLIKATRMVQPDTQGDLFSKFP